MQDACLVSHLVLEGDFTTSELRAINWCRMSKSILFIRDIIYRQGNHIQQSATDKSMNFNLIRDFNQLGRTTQKQNNGGRGENQ